MASNTLFVYIINYCGFLNWNPSLNAHIGYRQTTSAQCCWCYNIRIPWWISVHEGLSILTDSSWPVFSPMIVNSYWFTKLTLRSLIAILYRAATFHVNLSKLLAPQMRVTSDISFLFPPNPSLWLFILDACRVYAERVKIHRCACVSAKANVRPKTSQCSNILYTHGNQTFLTYLTPNPQEMKRLRVWKMTQNLNRYPPAKQLKRGCSTLDMEPFWESRLKMSPGEMMQMGALENDTGC